MQCSVCGSEWNTKSTFSQINNCPFCGCSLIRIRNLAEDLKLSDAISQVIDQFGEDIVLQKKKFISILSDIAPNLKKERKMLSVAMDEKIAELFLDCSIEDREVHILSVQRKLEGILSETAIEIVINAFADAFGWDFVFENSLGRETEKKVLQKSNHTETFDFSNSDELLRIAKKLLNSDSSLFDFNSKRFTSETTDPKYKYACRELNLEHFQNAFEVFNKLTYPDPQDHSRIGNVQAGVKLAQMYFFGDGMKKSNEKAAHIFVSLIPYNNPLVFAWISELFRISIPYLTVKDPLLSREIYRKCSDGLNSMAHTGDPDAAYFIGFNLIYGFNCTKDGSLGLSYLKTAADSGNIRAKVHVALCFMEGVGISTDISKGISLLMQLNNTQNSKVQYQLGLIYYLDKYKDYVAQNDAIAFQHFRKAAESGHSGAQDYVGDFYYYGCSVSIDYKEARKWYELSSKAGNNHATSQLGNIYYYGEGTPEDIDKAFNYYKMAADKGNVHSQYMLYYFYFDDGKFKDYETGRRYMEKAAESGSVEAQKLLSRLYLSDFGFNDDFKFAYWMKKAAEQGDAEAQRIYGQAIINFDNEKAIKKDYNEAIQWLSKAAAQGDVTAMIDIAELLTEGIGVPANADFAFRMIMSAVEIIQGEIEKNDSDLSNDVLEQIKRMPLVLIKTGKVYLSEKKESLAFQCYDMSVSLEENGENCRLLGLCYKNGTGVKKDKKMAKDLLKKAASFGDSIAKNELSKVFFY